MTYMQKKNQLADAILSKRKERIDSFKQVFELLKHMTTLSSGSILLLLTFSEKIIHSADPNKWVGIAFVAFCISITFALGTMFFISLQRGEKPTNGEVNFFAYTMMISVVGFLIGMSSIAYTAYKYLV